MYYIYKYVENDKIIYIGKTINLKQRIYQHSSEKKFMKHPNASIYFFECSSEADMTIYEIYYIYKYKPELNVTYNQRPDSFINEIILNDKEWKEYQKAEENKPKELSEDAKERIAQKKKEQQTAFEQALKQVERDNLRKPLPFNFDENYMLNLEIKNSLSPGSSYLKKKGQVYSKHKIYDNEVFEEYQAPMFRFLYEYLNCHECDIENDITKESVIYHGFKEKCEYYSKNYYLTKEQYENMILASFSFARDNCSDNGKIARWMLAGWRRNSPSKKDNPSRKENTVYNEDIIIEYYDKKISSIIPVKVLPIHVCQFYKTAVGVRVSLPIQGITLRQVARHTDLVIKANKKFLETLATYNISGEFTKSS